MTDWRQEAYEAVIAVRKPTKISIPEVLEEFA
jgi:hypothetical protein